MIATEAPSGGSFPNGGPEADGIGDRGPGGVGHAYL